MEEFDEINNCQDSLYAVEPMPAGKTLKYMALTVKYLLPLRDAFMAKFSKDYTACATALTNMMLEMNSGRAAFALVLLYGLFKLSLFSFLVLVYLTYMFYGLRSNMRTKVLLAIMRL